MNIPAVQELKEYHRRGGARSAVTIDDEEMRRVTDVLARQAIVVETPPAELRYIEGLLRLPLFSIEEFFVIPASGHPECACGRTPTALDLVVHAVESRLHDEQLLRDTLSGEHNLFEFADEGRAAPCLNCGREFLSGSYWTHNYLYA
ncbi:hypothetical protein [Nonomuraea wenchangensis]|uniref:Uncharacterized protein n=1 Tax=Nonomuraea wenchangensis TaxID=568860 RepID=A0A1I0KCA4_9ACTN|nr:hypothetical protein [Nonomuraea wenchangensis]SEU21902.1 hypothetical protein SAMN05421811_107428 [Nonomuraea wenchangensis]